MFEKKLIAVLVALLLPYCATTSPLSEEERQIARANATVSTSAVAVPAAARSIARPLLAIEVEITADGVTPVGATIVHAPPKPNSAFGDLRVQAVGADWEYTMADPRLVEIYDPNERRTTELESARGYVFVPLLVAVTGISIQPLAEMREKVSRGGKFDVRALAEEACARARLDLPVCREIVARSGRGQ